MLAWAGGSTWVVAGAVGETLADDWLGVLVAGGLPVPSTFVLLVPSLAAGALALGCPGVELEAARLACPSSPSLAAQAIEINGAKTNPNQVAEERERKGDDVIDT